MNHSFLPGRLLLVIGLLVLLWGAATAGRRSGGSLPDQKTDRHLALSFRSDLTFNEMWEVLQRKSSLKWHRGDSEYCGVYMWSETLRDRLTDIRVLSEGELFVVNIDYLFGVPDSMPYEEVRAIVDKEILPLLGARDIQPHARCE
ncbi:MAG TPA: hypothetical protein VN903_23170 [Polyangia bacterium]|jgi:hypothetical protein|nr:hypothetical protein [Polyangia bacterium]